MLTKKWDQGALIALVVLVISGLVYVVTLKVSVDNLKEIKANKTTTVTLDTRLKNLESGDELNALKNKVIEDLKIVKANIERSLNMGTYNLPIGSIIDYIGPIESTTDNPTKMLADGYFVWVRANQNWAIANGATIPEGNYSKDLVAFDTNSALGFQVPNIINKFTKGVLPEMVGEIGGVKTNTVDLSHRHSISPCSDANGHNALLCKGWANYNANCNERSSSSTSNFKKSIVLNNEPQYVGVLKVIRIK